LLLFAELEIVAILRESCKRTMMATGSAESQESVERRITALLQPLFDEQFRVIYDTAFPRQDGSKCPWLQVIFAVASTDDATARAQVHERFVSLLTALASLREVRSAEIVSLRLRRHVPPRTAPDHPHMFIECAWHGAAIAEMQRDRRFLAWHSYCYSYVNRFDSYDPLNIQNRSA
jgi:hypothetical protein